MSKIALAVLVAAMLLAGPALLPFESSITPKAMAGGKLAGLEGVLSGGAAIASAAGGGKAEAALVLLLVEFFVRIAPYLLFPRVPFTYQDFPYQYEDGYIIPPYQAAPGDPQAPLTGRAITFEIRGSYMIDSPELHGYRGYAKVRLSYMFTMDIEATQFYEWQEGVSFDTLTFAKLDGLFNISNSRYHDIDLGFGYSYIDGVDYFGGLNVKLMGDVFPVWPIGIHFMGGLNVFEGGGLYETEIEIGIFLDRFEFRIGYRALWVGDLELNGPMASLAIWF